MKLVVVFVRLGELGGKSKPAFSCLTLIDSCGGSIKYDLMVAGSKYYLGWFCTLHNLRMLELGGKGVLIS